MRHRGYLSLLVGVAVAAPLYAQQPPPVAASPPPGILVTCQITPNSTTDACEAPTYLGPSAAQAIVDELKAHPLHLEGAPMGQRIEIALIRAQLGADNKLGRPTARASSFRPRILNAGAGVSRFYPERAMRMNTSGQAVIRCKVTDDGHLNECFVLSESPPEWGFGTASLRASQYFEITPPTPEAPVYDHRVYNFPINWNLPH